MCSQQTAGETPAKQQRRLVGGPALFPTKRTAAEEHVDPPGRGSAGRPALGVRASQPVLHPSAAAGTRPRRGALRSVLLLLLLFMTMTVSLLFLLCRLFLFFFAFSYFVFRSFSSSSSRCFCSPFSEQSQASHVRFSSSVVKGKEHRRDCLYYNCVLNGIHELKREWTS